LNKNDFYPVLLSGSISHNYINPGEALFVTLNMYNEGQKPAPGRYRFVMDMVYGHQRKIENKQYNYRVTAETFPATTRWERGTEAAVTLRWEVTAQWSGTYHLRIGILDENDMPVQFFVPGVGAVYSFEVGDVDTSWGFGRPWTAEHTQPVFKQYGNINTPMLQQKYTQATIALRDEITLTLGKDIPCIMDLNGVVMEYAMPEIQLKRMNNNTYLTIPGNFILIENTDKYALYRASIFHGNIAAAKFTLTYTLKRNVLSVKVSDISESAGYELLSVVYPTFAEMETGYLLDFYNGGRLVPIEEATPVFFEKNYDVRNAAVLYDNANMIIVESTHIDSKLTTGVYHVNREKRGFIGGAITCRIPAEGNRPGIQVKEPPVFTLEIFDTEMASKGWQEAARLLRRGIKPAGSRSLYRDCYFYKQLATWGPEPAAHYRNTDPHTLTQNLFKYVTFAEIAENTRKFSNLTDRTKQIVYVTGFQKDGFDNAYPYPFDTDTRCGSPADLAKSLTDMRKYNAVSGLHDNMDDVSYPHWDDFPHIAQDTTGKPWRGWVWPAGQTKIISLCPYVESGDLKRRVEKMIDLLPLKDSYHIDVLTAETCRYDFNPTHPASAEDSFRAKLAIINEWNQYGIDITSEMLSHPSTGHIGFALHTRMETKEVFIPGDSFVPLVHMIYHGIIGYSAPSTTKEEILWGLLVGGQTFHEADITGPLCVSRFYIQNIPAMKLYDKFMTDYTHENGRIRAEYGMGSYVSVDFTKGTYEVVVDGILIGQDFSTFVPANTPGAYLAYAFEGEPVMYPRPSNFSGAVRAVALTEEGEGEVLDDAVQLDGDTIILTLPPMTPVLMKPAGFYL